MSPKLSPNDLTRQQLDELDGLLQRMLSLPTTGPSADPPEPVPELPPLPGAWRLDRPSPEPRPHVAAPDPELVPLTAEPLAALGLNVRRDTAPDPLWGPDPLARYHTPAAEPRLFAPPTADTGVPPSTATVRGADAPALPAGFRSAFADLPPIPAPAAPKVEAVPAPPPMTSSVPFFLWPVFAVNWVLETLLSLFGPLGSAVKHPAAKHLLGACGVLLLAAAGAWSARGMGWVALPFPR